MILFVEVKVVVLSGDGGGGGDLDGVLDGVLLLIDYKNLALAAFSTQNSLQ